MYQQHKSVDLSYLDNPEKEFDKLISLFINPKISKKYSKEFNLDVNYTPVHACIWNKIENIGLRCIIAIKNDRFAIVLFNKKDTEFTADKIYRLEDLKQIN